MTTTAYHCAHAWLGPSPVAADPVRQDVMITVTDGRIVGVEPDVADPPRGAVRLEGVVLPGFANAHSHAFHRGLRGRTHTDGGTFWTWREQMYALAARLDPDSYCELATAVYAEMVLAGITCVGEFHYVHHQADGSRYQDPNVMGAALQEAARRAGIRLTLLDTCYLASAIGEPLRPEQRRFGDGDVDRWAARVVQQERSEQTRLGVAIHSVRAVPAAALQTIMATSSALGADAPVHVHVSEQPAENDACLSAYGVTPVQLLADHGVLGPLTTAVHATHLSADDIGLLGGAHAYACFCPTTERDLADGIGPAVALRDAGARLTLGSDQHAVVDLLEEARALEMHERLASGQRGRFAPAELVQAMTTDGHASLGWPDAGRIEVGALADLVAVRLDTVRTAGSDPAQVVLAASTADVDTVVVGGRMIVSAGRHGLGDVGRLLAAAVRGLREAPA